MDESIPPYLFALAVGDLASAELGPRSRVWAEPAMVQRAAWEFEAVDRMLTSAEALLGPYSWGRFDLLVLPPSFPYGGMENPRLTFLTPTLITGDRSLVNVVAHELAHSWTGNLVSNASAEDFWLNEGFTVFVERRLLELLEGPELLALHAAVGRQALDEAVGNFRDRPQLTRLRTHLARRGPRRCLQPGAVREGLPVPPCGGGRGGPGGVRRLPPPLHGSLPLPVHHHRGAAGLHPPGSCPGRWRRSTRRSGSTARASPPRRRWPGASGWPGCRRWARRRPRPRTVARWTPWEWTVYLNRLPRPAPAALLEALDRTFGLTAARNPEVLVAWLTLAVRSGYAPAVHRTEAFLGEVGRMKYLKPLYAALVAGPGTRPVAEACIQRYRRQYHAIALAGVESLLRRGAA